MRVAFLGPPGSNSDDAAVAYFGTALDPLPCDSFAACFAAVAEGAADRALVPIENALAGSIHQNYDLLLRHVLHIIGEHNFYVRHNLLAPPGVPVSAIRRVVSHPQALEQCDRYLTALGVEREPVAATTLAARQVRDSGAREVAAIAGTRAAVLYGLAVLAAGIEDSAENFTRFLVLARAPETPPAGVPAKTSLVFTLENVPGSLFAALGVFARRGLNLSKIESRPWRERRWEYLFYLDFTAGLDAPAARDALQELEGMAPLLRVLGSYRQAPG